jgi:hypothetical protein
VAVESAAFLHIIISIGVLLLAAKLLAELFSRFRLPIVLGELTAGIIVGPFALGAIPAFNGEPLVVLDETVRDIGDLCDRNPIHSRPGDNAEGVFQGRRRGLYRRVNRCDSAVLCRVLRL